MNRKGPNPSRRGLVVSRARGALECRTPASPGMARCPLRHAVVMAVCLLLSASSALGGEWQPARLWVTGSAESIWVVGASEDKEGQYPLIQMWYAGGPPGGRETPRQHWRLPPISGDVLRVGADAGAMHILFSDLSIRDHFGDRKPTPGALYRSQCSAEPLALGGDAAEAVFWALVESESLVRPTTQSIATQDGEDVIAQGRLALLQLRDGRWRRLPVPWEAPPDSRFWLSGRSGRLYVFSQAPGEGVRISTLADGTWGAAEWVTEREDIRTGWAGARPEGPVFCAGVGEENRRVALRLFLHQDGAWSDAGAVRDGTEPLRIDPATCGVGVVRGGLGVARATETGRVEFGMGDLGVSPSIRFSVLSLGRSEPGQGSGWQDVVFFAAVLTMMTMVFWTRRGQATVAATVPPGMALAMVHRRVIATMLDYAPAFLVVVVLGQPWLLGQTGDLPQDLDWSGFLEVAADPEMAAKFAPMHYGSIALYGLWCLVWELAIGTTPGKLLFRCYVLGADGVRPRARQLVVRNVARVVVASLGPPGLAMTLMTMLILTRNRQRIGDMLARTIVVQARGDRGSAFGSDRGEPPPPSE